MKGRYITGLAAFAAAVALLMLRWLSPAPTDDFAPGPVDRLAAAASSVHERALPPSRVAAPGGAPSAAQRSEPGAPPREERREPSGPRVDPGGGSLQLAAGIERHRSLPDLAPHRADASADAADSEQPGDVLAARSAAVSEGHSQARDPNPPPPVDDNKRRTFEFVDGQPHEGVTSDLVLSLPLKGEVKPDVGGAAIQFDGLVSNGGQVQFPDNAQLSFPAGGTVNSKGGTISFDVQPQWSGADQTNNSLVQIRDQNIWENQLELVKNNDALRYIIHDSAGVEYNVNVPIDDWSPGEQRHITATWTDTNMALYVNGQLVGQTALANPVAFGDSTPVHIGSDFPGASYGGAGGAISAFKLFGRALDAGEVATL